MGICLKGGKVITATDMYEADVRIEGDKIVEIGTQLSCMNDEVMDVSGCFIMPGGIDTHTHFDLDVGSTVTADDFKSGTKAAIMGGTTTILDYATQTKGQSLMEAFNLQFKKSDNKCFCDYGFHMGITDWNDTVSDEMLDMVILGVPSFKLYMAYKKTLQVDDDVIIKALKRSKEVGGLLAFHCENGDAIEVLIEEAKKNHQYKPIHHARTRPALLEKEAITRLAHFSELTNTHVYVVHLSSQEGLKSILEAKKRGIKIWVETCPQYLLLDESYYGNDEDNSFEGAKYVMSPPLRTVSDQDALWEGLKTGEIDTIGTDHCSFNFHHQKELGRKDFTKIPNGAPGVEHRMALIYTYGVLTNKISLNQMVAQTSTNAAKIFGLYPRKGTIEVGSDADILVYDPNFETTISYLHQTQNVDYTPYEGFKQSGRVRHLFLRGNKVVLNAKLNINEPIGEYVHRTIRKG